jgi:hypothetical protein
MDIDRKPMQWAKSKLKMAEQNQEDTQELGGMEMVKRTRFEKGEERDE